MTCTWLEGHALLLCLGFQVSFRPTASYCKAALQSCQKDKADPNSSGQKWGDEESRVLRFSLQCEKHTYIIPRRTTDVIMIKVTTYWQCCQTDFSLSYWGTGSSRLGRGRPPEKASLGETGEPFFSNHCSDEQRPPVEHERQRWDQRWRLCHGNGAGLCGLQVQFNSPWSLYRYIYSQ